MNLVVQKYGGTSVGNIKKIKSIARNTKEKKINGRSGFCNGR